MQWSVVFLALLVACGLAVAISTETLDGAQTHDNVFVSLHHLPSQSLFSHRRVDHSEINNEPAEQSEDGDEDDEEYSPATMRVSHDPRDQEAEDEAEEGGEQEVDPESYEIDPSTRGTDSEDLSEEAQAERLADMYGGMPEDYLDPKRRAEAIRAAKAAIQSRMVAKERAHEIAQRRRFDDRRVSREEQFQENDLRNKLRQEDQSERQYALHHEVEALPRDDPRNFDRPDGRDDSGVPPSLSRDRYLDAQQQREEEHRKHPLFPPPDRMLEDGSAIPPSRGFDGGSRMDRSQPQQDFDQQPADRFGGGRGGMMGSQPMPMPTNRYGGSDPGGPVNFAAPPPPPFSSPLSQMPPDFGTAEPGFGAPPSRSFGGAGFGSRPSAPMGYGMPPQAFAPQSQFALPPAPFRPETPAMSAGFNPEAFRFRSVSKSAKFDPSHLTEKFLAGISFARQQRAAMRKRRSGRMSPDEVSQQAHDEMPPEHQGREQLQQPEPAAEDPVQQQARMLGIPPPPPAGTLMIEEQAQVHRSGERRTQQHRSVDTRAQVDDEDGPVQPRRTRFDRLFSRPARGAKVRASIAPSLIESRSAVDAASSEMDSLASEELTVQGKPMGLPDEPAFEAPPPDPFAAPAPVARGPHGLPQAEYSPPHAVI